MQVDEHAAGSMLQAGAAAFLIKGGSSYTLIDTVRRCTRKEPPDD